MSINEENIEVLSENEEETEVSDNNEEHNIPIDLSENEVYRGICTLLEDEDGNNILEYISLLHTELIGINKSLENLKSVRKDISRIADCAELFLKSKGEVLPEQSKKNEDIVKKVKKVNK
jgi:hypothetical protein